MLIKLLSKLLRLFNYETLDEIVMMVSKVDY